MKSVDEIIERIARLEADTVERVRDCIDYPADKVRSQKHIAKNDAMVDSLKWVMGYYDLTE